MAIFNRQSDARVRPYLSDAPPADHIPQGGDHCVITWYVFDVSVLTDISIWNEKRLLAVTASRVI